MSDHYSTIPGVDEDRDLTDLGGVTEKKAEYLRDAGYETIADIRAATIADLADVHGIGRALAARIKAHAGSSRT